MKKIKIGSLKERILIEELIPDDSEKIIKRELWACILNNKTLNKELDDLSIAENRYLIVLRKKNAIQSNIKITYRGTQLKIVNIDRESDSMFIHITAEAFYE